MKSVIIIPSRMASKRFPGKPLVKINGIPMIHRVWQQAIASNLGDVYVACSEKVVYDLIQNLGGKAIITDPNLPSGTDRIHSALSQISNLSEIEHIINLQGDMPLISPEAIKKVIEPLEHNYSIGTIATDLKENELLNPNITKILVDWKNDKVGMAKEFFRKKYDHENEVFHHVGIYSFTKSALSTFVNLPKSKNESLLNLEQYRAIDAGISVGVSFVKDIPPSVDTKEDLTTVENIIRADNE